MNVQAAQTLYNHYHDRVINYPTLYTGESYVTVVLPEELLEFANAAAGHSNYRPIGIRSFANDPKERIKEIFSSVESLIEFISSSECNAIQHIKQLKIKAAVKKQKTESARSIFWKKYDKGVMEKLKACYNPTLLREAFDTMSMSQFEKEFNL